MRPIPVGAKGTYSLRVMPAHLANQFKDISLPQVFATPMMVTAMENAALNAVRDYLDPGESCVGTLVNVKHLAATPVGHRVTAAMFTISYSCAVIVPVISGILWDLSGIAAFAFLPIVLCGILLVILAPAINHVRPAGS